MSRTLSMSLWLLVSSLLLRSSAYAENAQEPLGNTGASNDTLFWGPYRPNVYFGVRPRLPNSLLAGLMWANGDDIRRIQTSFRHTCEQSAEIKGYGWEEYDAQLGGREVIHDIENKVDLTIDYVKMPGGSHGGNWGARVRGKIREDEQPLSVTTVIFYVGLEGQGDIELENELSDKPYKGPINFRGASVGLGDFKIEVTEGDNNFRAIRVHEAWDEKPLDGTLVLSTRLPGDYVWKAKEMFFTSVKPYIDELVEKYGADKMPPPWQAFTMSKAERNDGNVHLVQKIFVGDFQFDVLYNSDSSAEPITSQVLDERIPEVSKSFRNKFAGVFKQNKPFTGKRYESCAESLFSNLLGGIGYFYGDSLVDKSYATEYEEENEAFWEDAANARSRNPVTPDVARELFTSVPSRPFFPRGFLWDEGFHLIPIMEWDADLALEIVKSWFRLMDGDGWIAREQILGAEARSKVPQEFQTQYPHYANPPTLFMIISKFVEKIKADKFPAPQAEKFKAELAEIYPQLVRHYNWYRRTQSGDIKTYDREAFSKVEAYRWRGRTPQHILPSGLDDYPRAQPPRPGELHLDLISWMGMAASSLSNVANLLSETEDATRFSKQHDAMQRNIDDLHWSSSEHMYCDATIDDYDEHSLVCHKGYISLFPFMTKVLPPTHPNIPAILDLISSSNHLWSNHGIRSLSKSSEFYGTEENYWRSPIWVNMNYLILEALLNLSTDASTPAKVKTRATKIYSDLRKNIVETVVTQWEKTGFAWEQYNPETGDGQRTQHFTGWTSLVVNIMGMPDLSGGDIEHSEL